MTPTTTPSIGDLDPQMDETIVRWTDWSGTGFEHLVLREGPSGVAAEAVLLSSTESIAFAAQYRIVCDQRWRVRLVEVHLIGGDRRLELRADGAGNWTEGPDTRPPQPLPQLQGAIDVDLSATPFTNTLPIRRLRLRQGEAADIVVVYIALPDLVVTTDPQRYTCIELGRRYRFESLDGDFVREIEVDDKGLAVSYPGLFRRIA